MSQSNNGSVWTLTLSSELQARTEALRKEGQSHRDVMEQVYKLGLYQLEYRNAPEAVASRKKRRRPRGTPPPRPEGPELQPSN